MKATEDLKAAKAAKARGFAQKPQTQAVSKQEPISPVAPAVTEAQDHALQFMGAAQKNLATQLQQKVEALQSLDEMLEKAAVSIATAEQDILSGVSLERKLAGLRAEYMQLALADAAVSLEFEALTAIETLATPVAFPDVQDTIKAISPSAKSELDKAVFGPAK